MAKIANQGAGLKPTKQRRKRVPKNLARPACGEQPFAKRRPELKGLTPAQMVLLLVESYTWKMVMRPILDAIDGERATCRDRRGGHAVYSAEQIEMALAYQRAAGLLTYKAAYEKLCGADSEARETLGFTQPNHKRATRNLDGVPSPAAVSRHLKRFGAERRGDAWDALARAYRDYHLANFPEMRAESKIAHIDGTGIKIPYTAPIIDPKTDMIINAKSVTAPDAGYLPPSAGEAKAGHGWNLIPISTSSGVPLAWSLPKLHESESVEATKLVLGEFAESVIPHLDREGEIGVACADGAFAAPELRLALRSVGYIENIHNVSHGDSDKIRRRAAEQTELRIPIENHPTWFANGHRELVCACGEGIAAGRFRRLKSGRISPSVEGECPNCGSISITSGEWKKVQNPTQYVEIDPSNPDEEPDYLFGNRLTYNHPLSSVYGNHRRGHGEGLYGTLSTRFKLIENKRKFRTVHHARAEVGVVFSLIHVLAMEQRKRKAQAAPAQLALAA